MTKIELLNAITYYAKDYTPNAAESITRNSHMNDLKKFNTVAPSQIQIDALIVDFINYIGACQGIDYAINTSDLRDSREINKADEFFQQ